MWGRERQKRKGGQLRRWPPLSSSCSSQARPTLTKCSLHCPQPPTRTRCLTLLYFCHFCNFSNFWHSACTHRPYPLHWAKPPTQTGSHPQADNHWVHNCNQSGHQVSVPCMLCIGVNPLSSIFYLLLSGTGHWLADCAAVSFVFELGDQLGTGSTKKDEDF